MVRLKVLFLCVGNSCRSQMAEAIARHVAYDVIEPSSAGLSPLGRISDLTRIVLLEREIALNGQYSKPVNDARLVPPDLIINMSGMPGNTLFESHNKYEDWDVEDPYGEDIETHRRVCEDVAARVLHLAARLRKQLGRNPA